MLGCLLQKVPATENSDPASQSQFHSSQGKLCQMLTNLFPAYFVAAEVYLLSLTKMSAQ